MKRIVSVLIVIILIVTGTSCSKSLYPRDPYRGAHNNPYYYQNNRLKAKKERPFRRINGQPFKSNVSKLPKGKSTLR